MQQLRVFWTFFGGKRRIASKYPKPRYRRIIEPFAGSAGYSLIYPAYDVVLVEQDQVIAGIWRWLIKVKKKDVLNLPMLPESGRLDDTEWPCIEAKNLAGFWITRGASRPNKSASSWMRDDRYKHWSWGRLAIERIAYQVEFIRHWTIIEGSYNHDGYGLFKDSPATWFIDPPYIGQGFRYKHGSSGIDYNELSGFCRYRLGQVIVCEQLGAEWLPFRKFYMAKSNESAYGGKISEEVIWTNPGSLPAK